MEMIPQARDRASTEGPSPASKTGMETAQALIDWLAFTLPAGSGVDWVRGVLGHSDWTELPHGYNGYDRCLVRGGARILWHSRDPRMGIHCVLSGKGCRELEALAIVGEERDEGHRYDGPMDWRRFLKLLSVHGAKFTRVDFALDDRAGVLSMETMEAALKGGLTVSRARAWEPRGARPLDGGPAAGGRTLTLGSRASETYVRIYDKAAEQRSKGRAVEGHWVRVELETKGKRATALVREVCDHGLRAVAGYLRGHLDFKERGTHSQKERWNTADWWATFLRGAAKLRLAVEPAVRTIEDVKGWFRHQVAPSLALILAVAQGDLSWLMEVAKEGEERWKERHRAIYAGAVT